MEKIIIGIIGKKSNGKDTVGDYLSNHHGFKKYNFADPIKQVLSDVFSLSYNQLYGDEKEIIDEFWGVTPRELMQKIGTELFQYELPKIIEPFKNYGRSFWVKCFEQWYTKYGNNDNIVISDVRFLHEANKIKEMGGILVKIHRDIKENTFSQHSSETELDEIKFDYFIENNGTLDILYSKIDDFLKKIDI